MGIGSVISGAASWVKNTAEDAVDAGADALKGAQDFVGDRLDDIDQAKDWVGGKIDGAVEGAEKAVDGFRQDLVEFGEEHGGIVGKALAENVSNSIGVVEGAGLAVYDMGKGVVQLADGASKLVNPLEWATHGGENLQRLENVGKAAETLGNLASPTAWITNTDGNLNTAKALWNGVTAGYQDAAAQGDWSKFVGRGVVDIGSLLIGAGEANAAIKGAQGANAVARIGEGANALDKAADAARVLDAAGDAGKAARGADGAADAGKVARGADEAAAARATAGSDDVAEIVSRADTGTTIGGKKLLDFDSFDDFNAAANAAQPNSVYQFGDFRWTTDAQGRVIRAEGKVELTPVGRNDPKLQTAIGNEGRDTDVGFHIIADRFGGPTNRLNVVPGNGKPIGDGLPNLNNGAYKRFENTIAELREQGHAVEIRVSPEYNPGNLSSRPDNFVAEYRTDGGRWIEHEFPNK
ncbi:DNA/RNA non-specific endonuclease [Dokdonella ginsengisoli]|uniref:DNA/RNA non-specific endonuclease n=1 Tax=Dokdonella ginsengisoli TaxID=363846 RepID=A0ABV9QV19_9GAMM